MGIPDITEESLRSFPKVLLHDHLDGGLRPETIIEIAHHTNYLSLPSNEAKELEAWMLSTADQGKLELYLEAFTHTIAVMQSEEVSSKDYHTRAVLLVDVILHLR